MLNSIINTALTILYELYARHRKEETNERSNEQNGAKGRKEGAFIYRERYVRKSVREMANNFSFSCVELLSAKSHRETFAYYGGKII